mmetsp:Transcript_12662/g.22797  ORF Transcript_12662/g.22797 Transcript_12662/m.22797 type:complete len:220 (-) Transcript_12662:92-751(-)|eukprot:CAMPEP_0182447380 /NCGR_PEP_ID=MMETSP1172-20130603/15433_1 /TAXON_ID=708627 /ORGANISM="Timspurckia oligopyrenoides, Strain CCMP3278" /LENGTH=219 /DNA_ID=CAMNT_0024643797 /DNA_START=262 /DNA_END=921 /DNA_ORIENTATION=+
MSLLVGGNIVSKALTHCTLQSGFVVGVHAVLSKYVMKRESMKVHASARQNWGDATDCKNGKERVDKYPELLFEQAASAANEHFEKQFVNHIEDTFGNISETIEMSNSFGPGLRYVIKMEEIDENTVTVLKNVSSSKQVAESMKQLAPFLKSSNGGLSLAGNGWKKQMEFSKALWREANRIGISTCVEIQDVSSHSDQNSWKFVENQDDLVTLTHSDQKL